MLRELRHAFRRLGSAPGFSITGTLLYIPYLQSPFIPNVLAVRTEGDPLLVVDRIRATLFEIDPDIRLEDVRTMESVIDGELAGWRFRAALVTVFAVSAFVLASLGVFALVAHGVSRRVRDIALRMALGADRGRVLRLVLREGMEPVLPGIVSGLVVAGLLARVLAAHLHGIEPTDPMTFALVATLMTAVGVCACYLPARRASRLDPAVVLRSE